jgi:hypothetical protein
VAILFVLFALLVGVFRFTTFGGGHSSVTSEVAAHVPECDLSTEGTKGHSVSYLVAKMKCPSCATRGSSMPVFAALGPKNLRLLPLFLASSKRGA